MRRTFSEDSTCRGLGYEHYGADGADCADRAPEDS